MSSCEPAADTFHTGVNTFLLVLIPRGFCNAHEIFQLRVVCRQFNAAITSGYCLPLDMIFSIPRPSIALLCATPMHGRKIHLRLLDSTGHDFSDADITRLVTHLRLHSLDLSGCRAITCKTLAMLCDHENSQNLSELKVNDCASILTLGFRCLSRLPSLTTLMMSWCAIKDFRFLSSLPNLQSLDVSWTRITDNDLQHLSSMTQLQSLSLSDCKGISCDGVRKALSPHLSSLTALNVSGSKIDISRSSLLNAFAALDPNQLRTRSVTNWTCRF